MKNIKEYTFDELWERIPQDMRTKCDECRQDSIYHPEGVVTNHIRLVFEWAQDHYDDVDLLLASLFHDLGKPETQTIFEKDGREKISNKMHELKAEKYINEFFDLYSDISTDKEKIVEICNNHMKAHLYKRGTMKKAHKRRLFEDLKNFKSIMEFLECDENGR